MSQSAGPPPPPKRKNHKPVAVYGTGSGIPIAVGSGHNVARIINETTQQNTRASTKAEVPVPQNQFRNVKNRICVIEDHPDAVIGFGVEIHGDFQFDKVLRVDGRFQGNLFSSNHGDIIVGKSGCIIGDVIIARKMIVEGGHIIGKIVAEELLLLDHTIVKGDITCKLLQIEGPSVTINGRANVHALAPEIVDENDNIITEFPKKAKKPKREVYAPHSPSKPSAAVRMALSEEDTDIPESTSQSSPNRVAKSSSVQTNASAKPARNPQPLRDPEEAAALEAAMAERNAAKERHRQAKAAKRGEIPPPGSADAEQPTGGASMSKGAERAGAAMAVNTAVGEVGAEVSKKSSPTKSPAKMLPPSAAQRQAQLARDRGDGDGAGAERVYDPPDVEREKAAINVQRVARGRLVRRRTQSNELTAKTEVKKTKSEGELDLSIQGVSLLPEGGAGETDPELQKQTEAAIELQKIARGRQVRQEIAKQNEAAVNVQKIARGKLARNAVAAKKGGNDESGAAAAGEGSGPAGESTVEPDAAAAAPAGAGEAVQEHFGPGYTEMLAANS